MLKELLVGPAKHIDQSKVRFGIYYNGKTSIILVHPNTGERLAVATVNIYRPGVKETGPGFVWLKGWSENEGIPEALEKAGIVKRTGETFLTGFVKAELAEILVGTNR